MVDRMIRAAKADIELYEEVEHSPSLTQEAYTIVGIVAAISAVINIVIGLIFGGGSILGSILQGVLFFVGYLLWSYLTFLIGTKLFHGTADYGELQRTLGYAYTPMLFVLVLTFIGSILPTVIGVVFILLAILPLCWALYLAFVAVRQALDIDNMKTLLTVIIAVIPQLIIMGILNSILL